MGIRNGMRATADIQALGYHQPPSIEYMSQLGQRDLKESLSERDRQFGDYREGED
jgi:enoyl-CoA hydratase